VCPWRPVQGGSRSGSCVQALACPCTRAHSGNRPGGTRSGTAGESLLYEGSPPSLLYVPRFDPAAPGETDGGGASKWPPDQCARACVLVAGVGLWVCLRACVLRAWSRARARACVLVRARVLALCLAIVLPCPTPRRRSDPAHRRPARSGPPAVRRRRRRGRHRRRPVRRGCRRRFCSLGRGRCRQHRGVRGLRRRGGGAGQQRRRRRRRTRRRQWAPAGGGRGVQPVAGGGRGPADAGNRGGAAGSVVTSRQRAGSGAAGAQCAGCALCPLDAAVSAIRSPGRGLDVVCRWSGRARAGNYLPAGTGRQTGPARRGPGPSRCPGRGVGDSLMEVGSLPGHQPAAAGWRRLRAELRVRLGG
jgi:hypothetical protein